MASVCWLYYFSKFIEMLDTVSVHVWHNWKALRFTGFMATANLSLVNWQRWVRLCLNMLLSFQIFFVLRKKNNQVTFLHVYHHSIMPFTWWFGVRFAAGTWLLLNNQPIFSIMYAYLSLFEWLLIYSLIRAPMQEVWEHSTPCSTVSSMFSCIHTTAWLPWAPATRSSCGGRSTSLPSSWYVR